MGIVSYADQTKETFYHINWETMFSKLGSPKFRRSFSEIKNEEVFQRCRGHFERRIEVKGIGWIGVRETASIVEDYATLGIRSEVLLTKLGDDARRIVQEGNTQEITYCLHALICFDIRENELLKAVDAQDIVMKLVREGTVKCIAHTIWILATLGHQAPNLARAIDIPEVVMKLVKEEPVQDVANAIWALATLDHQAKDPPTSWPNSAQACTLARAIDSEEVVTRIVREGKPQEISNTLRAMATLGHKAPTLAGAINSDYVVDMYAKEGTMQAFSYSIWAMSKLKYDCPRLVEALVVRGGEIIGTGTNQEISNTAFALADLGYFNKEVFEQIGMNADIVAKGNTKDVANTLWAFGISGIMAKLEESVSMLWDEAMERPVEEFEYEDWKQLGVARLFAMTEGIYLEIVDDNGRWDMMEMTAMDADEDVNNLEREIAHDLTRFGFSGFETEASPFDDGEGGSLMEIGIA